MIKRFKSNTLSQFKTKYSRSLIFKYDYFFERNNSCNICQSYNFYVFSNRDKHGCKYPLAICSDCNNVFSVLKLKESKIGEYYNGKANIIKVVKSLESLFEGRISKEGYSYDRFNYIYDNIDLPVKDYSIVEIGCSDGSNLFHFHKKGYQLVGFDYNETRINTGLSKGLNLIKVESEGEIYDSIIDIKSKKLIILSHFIEHVTDVYEYFCKLIICLNKGDLVFIETPSLDFVLEMESHNKLYPNDQNFINHLQLEHTYFFQKDQLELIMEYFGFNKLNSNNIYRGLFLYNGNSNKSKKSFSLFMKRESNKYNFIEKLNDLEKKFKNNSGVFKYLVKYFI